MLRVVWTFLILSLSYYCLDCLGRLVVLVFVLDWGLEALVLGWASEDLALFPLRFLILRLILLLCLIPLLQSLLGLDLLQVVLGSSVGIVLDSLVLGFLVLAVCVRWSLGMPGQALE